MSRRRTRTTRVPYCKEQQPEPWKGEDVTDVDFLVRYSTFAGKPNTESSYTLREIMHGIGLRRSPHLFVRTYLKVQDFLKSQGASLARPIHMTKYGACTVEQILSHLPEIE